MLALTQLSRYLMDMAMGQHDGVVVQHSLDLIGKKQDSSPPHPPPNEQDANRGTVCSYIRISIQWTNPLPTPSPTKLVSNKNKL